MAKPGELHFTRIFDFNLIPRPLIEQIPELPYTTEKLYDYAKAIGRDPFTLLYCLADKDHKIKGFFWGTICPLDESISVHLYSVEKGCQKGENFVRRCLAFLDELTNKVDVTVRFSTLHPKAFERAGCIRSKFTSMEYISKAQEQKQEIEQKEE